MSWLLRHKFITLFIIAATLYWLKNPDDGFGFFRKGCAIYNRIPVLFFDCYVTPAGKLHLESDLSRPPNITYWIENHLTLVDENGKQNTALIIGTGFSGEKAVTLTSDQLRILRERKLTIEYLGSEEAIAKFNSLNELGTRAAILLRVK